MVPASDLDRVLDAVATHTQRIDARLQQLEQRFDETEQGALEAPTMDDVIQVRLHSARLAAELSRVTVELRAEIDHAAHCSLGKMAATLSQRDHRVRTVAETILDMAGGLDTLPADVTEGKRPDGDSWAATA